MHVAMCSLREGALLNLSSCLDMGFISAIGRRGDLPVEGLVEEALGENAMGRLLVGLSVDAVATPPRFANSTQDERVQRGLTTAFGSSVPDEMRPCVRSHCRHWCTTTRSLSACYLESTRSSNQRCTRTERWFHDYVTGLCTVMHRLLLPPSRQHPQG